jgi:hypothetical protein
MAPEETSTTSAPGTFSAIASTSASTRLPSRPPAAVVSEEEPTLTTIRRAPTTSRNVLTRSFCPARDLRPKPFHTLVGRSSSATAASASLRAAMSAPTARELRASRSRALTPMLRRQVSK